MIKNKKLKKKERKRNKRSKIIFLQCFFFKLIFFLKKINLKAFSYVERGGWGIKKKKKENRDRNKACHNFKIS